MYMYEFINQYADDGESQHILVDLSTIVAVERFAEYCTIHLANRSAFSVRIAYPELKGMILSINKVKHGLD